MTDLTTKIPLVSAGDYARPRRASESLPLVYGAMHLAGQGGLWPAVCLDTDAFVYALAGHELLPLADGNTVTLYDQEGAAIDAADYTLNLAHDLEGRGVIATATFDADAREREPIHVRAAGKPSSAGGLMTNPLDIARDLMVDVHGLPADELEAGSLARAWSRAEALGYRAAGVVASAQRADNLLTGLMGCFLGSWWRTAAGALRLILDLGPGSADEGELGLSLRQANLKEIAVSARLEEVANRVTALLAHSPRLDEYEEAWSAAQDLASQGLMGRRELELELGWVREAAVAATICGRLVELTARPRRVITLTETSLTTMALERGDAALLSLDWLCDPQGGPLVNQIVRVLSVEPQLTQGVIRYTVLDTGYHKTLADRADGSFTAGGAALAGGARDLATY